MAEPWTHQNGGCQSGPAQSFHQSGTAPGTTHVDPTRPHPGTAPPGTTSDIIEGRRKPSWTWQVSGYYPGTAQSNHHSGLPARGTTHVDPSRPHPGLTPRTSVAPETFSDVGGRPREFGMYLEDFPQKQVDAADHGRYNPGTTTAGTSVHYPGSAHSNRHHPGSAPGTSSDVDGRWRPWQGCSAAGTRHSGTLPEATSSDNDGGGRCFIGSADSRSLKDFEQQFDVDLGRSQHCGRARINHQSGTAAAGTSGDAAELGTSLEDCQKQSDALLSRRHLGTTPRSSKTPETSSAVPGTVGGFEFGSPTAETFADGPATPGIFSERRGTVADGPARPTRLGTFSEGPGVFVEGPGTFSDGPARLGALPEGRGTFSDAPGTFSEKPARLARLGTFSEVPTRSGRTSSNGEVRRSWVERCRSLENFQKQLEDAALGRSHQETEGFYFETAPTGTVGLHPGTPGTGGLHTGTVPVTGRRHAGTAAGTSSSDVHGRGRRVATTSAESDMSWKHFEQQFYVGRFQSGTAQSNRQSGSATPRTSTGSPTAGGFHPGTARPRTGKFYFDPAQETGGHHCRRTPGTDGFHFGTGPGGHDPGTDPWACGDGLDFGSAAGTNPFYHDPAPGNSEFYHDPTPGTSGHGHETVARTGGFHLGTARGTGGPHPGRVPPGTGGFYLGSASGTGEFHRAGTAPAGTCWDDDGCLSRYGGSAECSEKQLNAEPSVPHADQTGGLVFDTDWRVIDGKEE